MFVHKDGIYSARVQTFGSGLFLWFAAEDLREAEMY